jgi:endonuclease/exonuclease/phosphatase family metal-dependent hydrolase
MSPRRSSRSTRDPSELRFALWNVEWMNDLFAADSGPAAFRPDSAQSEHTGATIRQRRDDLAGVINDMAPDIMVLVEGPSRGEELQMFFDTDVEGTWQTVLQPSKGQTQNIGLAVRTDLGRFKNPPLQQFDTSPMEAFGAFLADTDDDGIEENYKFERRPVYAEIIPAVGQPFRILGLHLKSKGIFTAYEWSKWWSVADANRRKLLAQVSQIRQRFLDAYLAAPASERAPLIVCGDINDGPGLDASEKRLYGSAVERLMGNVWHPELCLRNALFESLSKRDQERLNFEKIVTTSFKDPIFNNVWQREWIDHILYSETHAATPWVKNARVCTKLSDGSFIWEKHKHASDHSPVMVDVVTA